MRQFMEVFDTLPNAKDEDDIVDILTDCAVVAMKQICPSINTRDKFEDMFDLKSMYKIIEYAGGIKMDSEDAENNTIDSNTDSNSSSDSKSSWSDLDLNKLESEAFLLGIWKNYDELESSICLSELMAILEQKREIDYQDKKIYSIS